MSTFLMNTHTKYFIEHNTPPTQTVILHRESNSTQYAAEHKPRFNIPLTCFGQAQPSSGRTCQTQNRKYLTFTFELLP